MNLEVCWKIPELILNLAESLVFVRVKGRYMHALSFIEALWICVYLGERSTFRDPKIVEILKKKNL